MWIKRIGDVSTPPLKRGTDHSAGFDLPSAIGGRLCVGEDIIIPTGWAVKMPSTMQGQIWARSGLAAKWGIQVNAGLIDADYHQEIKVILTRCLTNTEYDTLPFEFGVGDRIAQLVIMPRYLSDAIVVDDFERTESNRIGGFGSTGIAPLDDGTASVIDYLGGV